MVLANTLHGQTLFFDVLKSDDLALFAKLSSQHLITAASILKNKIQHTLTAPRGFRKSFFGIVALRDKHRSVIGEKIFVQAGDVRLLASSTFSSSVVRTDLVRTGNMMFSPGEIK